MKKSVQLINEDARTILLASIWCLYCQLETDFQHFFDVSIADFEQSKFGLGIYQLMVTVNNPILLSRSLKLQNLWSDPYKLTYDNSRCKSFMLIFRKDSG